MPVVVLVNLTDGARDIYVAEGPKLREQVRDRHEKYLASKGASVRPTPASKHTRHRA